MRLDEFAAAINDAHSRGYTDSAPVVVIDENNPIPMSVKGVEIEHHEDGISTTIWVKVEEL